MTIWDYLDKHPHGAVVLGLAIGFVVVVLLEIMSEALKKH